MGKPSPLYNIELADADGNVCGDGEEGEIVTHNARAIAGIPAQIRYLQRLVIVGEVYIPKPTFEKLRDTLRDGSGKPYKNARNMAAGSIRCYDYAACAGRGLAFSPFSVLEGLDEEKTTAESKYLKLTGLYRLGFSPCGFLLLIQNPSESQVSNSIAELRTMAETNGFPIDGIVVTYNDIPFSQAQGKTGHHPKDSVAFKFADDLHETILREIEWTPSRFGELSPVAIFDSVEIDGCEISRASLHNLTFITELELMPSCRILISKRNMIIPHVEENLDRGGFDAKEVFPTHCLCGGETRIKETGTDKGRIIRVLQCVNEFCEGQMLRKFVHFVGKKAMNIEGLSVATLETFIHNGWLSDFTDIYRLGEHEFEITSMEGFGKKSWARLQDAIQRSRVTTFERSVVAMDIPLIGLTAGRELCRHFNGDLDAFESAVGNRFDFAQLNDFGETLNRNIHDWFSKNENKNLWKELQKMTTIENKSPAASAASANNPFAGRTIVVTGTLVNFTRNTINAKIETLGAKAGNAVSKNTDYLVYGDNAGSKLDKARKLGVALLTEQEFINMAKGA
jgi:DNA ligase (NAD+)